jgi:hypothetical protein
MLPQELFSYSQKMGDMAADKLDEASLSLANLTEDDPRRVGPPGG